MNIKTRGGPPRPITRDAGKPKCPKCGSREIRTLNVTQRRYICLACDYRFKA